MTRKCFFTKAKVQIHGNSKRHSETLRNHFQLYYLNVAPKLLLLLYLILISELPKLTVRPLFMPLKSVLILSFKITNYAIMLF